MATLTSIKPYDHQKFVAAMVKSDLKEMARQLDTCSAIATVPLPKSKYGYSSWLPLGLAVDLNKLDVIELLLRHGAEPLQPDLHGKTALDRATHRRDAKHMLDAHLVARAAHQPPQPQHAMPMAPSMLAGPPPMASTSRDVNAAGGGGMPAAAPPPAPLDPSLLPAARHRCAQLRFQLEQLAFEAQHPPPPLPPHLARPSPGAADTIEAVDLRVQQLDWQLQALCWETKRPPPSLPAELEKGPALLSPPPPATPGADVATTSPPPPPMDAPPAYGDAIVAPPAPAPST